MINDRITPSNYNWHFCFVVFTGINILENLLCYRWPCLMRSSAERVATWSLCHLSACENPRRPLSSAFLPLVNRIKPKIRRKLGIKKKQVPFARKPRPPVPLVGCRLARHIPGRWPCGGRTERDDLSPIPRTGAANATDLSPARTTGARGLLSIRRTHPKLREFLKWEATLGGGGCCNDSRELGQTVGVRTKFRKLNVDVYARGISGFRPPMGDGLVSVCIRTNDVHANRIRVYAFFVSTMSAWDPRGVTNV